MRVFGQRGSIDIRDRQPNLRRGGIGVHKHPVKSPGPCAINAQGDTLPISGEIRHHELDIAQTEYTFFV